MKKVRESALYQKATKNILNKKFEKQAEVAKKNRSIIN